MVVVVDERCSSMTECFRVRVSPRGIGIWTEDIKLPRNLGVPCLRDAALHHRL